MCLTWSCVTGLHEKLPMGTRSHSTKLLHSFWSLSSGTVSQIVPGGRLIWSFQKLLTCPRFCNSNMSKTKGCLPPHPPSASVVGNTEICHTYALELSTWQLLHIDCAFLPPWPLPTFCRSLPEGPALLFLQNAGSLACHWPGGKWWQVTLCFIALPHLCFFPLLLSLYCLYQQTFCYLPASVRYKRKLAICWVMLEWNTHACTSTCQTRMWIFSDNTI